MPAAPVALFAFRRPDHFRRTVDALRANDLASATKVYVFCDGARSEADVEGVEEVRRVAETMTGFASVEVTRRPHNMGLAASIIAGVGQVLETHGRVIVVEDDLVTAPGFLRYMNTGLDLYADEARVASIHGYVYPLRKPVPETFFLRGADCWGWATWSRAWKVFNPDAEHLLSELERRALIDRFDFDGSFGFTSMLRDFIAGRNNSWAVRWHASAFLADMLTLYPGRSLVENIGLDASGTHCEVSSDFGSSVEKNDVTVRPIAIAECDTAREAFIDYFRGPTDEAPLAPRPEPRPGGLWGWIAAALRPTGR